VRRINGLFRLGLIWALFGGCGLLVILPACTKTTGPEVDKDPVISFVPDLDSLSLELGSQQELRIVVANAPGAIIRFIHGDSVVTDLLRYNFLAAKIGADSVLAEVVLADSIFSKRWSIEVQLGSQPPTPATLVLNVNHDLEPGTVNLTWERPAPAITYRPLARFVVGVNDEKLTNLEDWNSVVVLDEVEFVPDQEGYIRRYDFRDHPEIAPGQEAWFYVRVQDIAGVWSALGQEQDIRITTPYSVTGYVNDTYGNALRDILISFGCDTCKTITDSSGYFELGPFRDIDRYDLIVTDDGVITAGIGDFYDYVRDTVSVDTEQPLRLTLIRNWGIDNDCGDLHNGDFLDYLKHMTNTDRDLNDRPGRILQKWAEYPLFVYIEDAMSNNGLFSLSAAADTALSWWNSRMGETYFIETSDSLGADIEIDFTDGLAWIGIAEIVDPISGRINVQIPRRMRIRVKQNMATEASAIEVLLHEIGHALCLGEHSFCDGTIHLMNSDPSHIIEARYPESPIHDDETHAVNAIRHLPLSIDMDNYLKD